MVLNLQLPQNVGNFLTGRGTVKFARRTVLHVIGWLMVWFALWSGGELIVQLVSRVLVRHVDTLHIAECISVRFSHIPPKAQRLYFLYLTYC
jgi:acyl-CoA synthetase (AMP-forming)/AMP-acid ligase II